MDLVRNYTTMPISETFGTSGMSWFSPTVTDVFDNPDGSTDGSDNQDPSANSGGWGKTYSRIRASTNRPVLGWVLWGIGWIFALAIASIVANEMIMLPYQMRLIGFVAVLLAYYLRPFFFYCILIYYSFRYLYNTFTGAPKKTHYWFAFLPLRTAKDGDSMLVYLFTYFNQGTKGQSYVDLNTIVRPAAEKGLQEAFPNFENLKSQLPLGEFEKYLDALNVTKYEGPKVETAESVAKAEAEELLEDESRTAFERVGKTRSDLEEASKGLSKGIFRGAFGASKEAKEAADKAEVKLELAQRAFAAQKAAEKQKMEGLDYTKSNEAKQIFETHRLESEAEKAVEIAKAKKETTKTTGSNQSIRDQIKTIEQASFQALAAIEDAKVARAELDTKRPKLGVDELRNKAAELEQQASEAQVASEAAAKASATNSNLYFSKVKQDRYATKVQTEERYKRLQGVAEAARAKAKAATAAEAAKGSEKYKELMALNDIISKSAVDATAAKGAAASAEAVVAQAEKDIQANKADNPPAARDARIAKLQAEPAVAKTQRAAAAAEQKLQQARAAAAQKTAEQPK
jgi:hypothetical protein